MHTATGPGIASIFAVICGPNHAHFLTIEFSLGQGQCALAQKAALNMQFGMLQGEDWVLLRKSLVHLTEQ